jgi:hypothetical protein
VKRDDGPLSFTEKWGLILFLFIVGFFIVHGYLTQDPGPAWQHLQN